MTEWMCSVSVTDFKSNCVLRAAYNCKLSHFRCGIFYNWQYLAFYHKICLTNKLVRTKQLIRIIEFDLRSVKNAETALSIWQLLK